MPAAAVDAQQATSERARSARAALGERAGSSVDGVPRIACRGSFRGCGQPRRVGQSSRGITQRAPVRVGASEHGWVRVVLCACRGVGGDSPGPWPAHWHARIAQGPPRVGELQPEFYFLAVSGQFHELVKRRKNRLRASRACSRGAPGRAHPVGNARRARRCLAVLTRGTGSGRGECTEVRRRKHNTRAVFLRALTGMHARLGRS